MFLEQPGGVVPAERRECRGDIECTVVSVSRIERVRNFNDESGFRRLEAPEIRNSMSRIFPALSMEFNDSIDGGIAKSPLISGHG